MVLLYLIRKLIFYLLEFNFDLITILIIICWILPLFAWWLLFEHLKFRIDDYLHLLRNGMFLSINIDWYFCPNGLETSHIGLRSKRLVNNIGRVVLVLFLMEEKDGFCCWVVYSWVKGCLNQMMFTSWMDCFYVMHSLRKMYFCCFVTLLYFVPFILFLVIL